MEPAPSRCTARPIGICSSSLLRAVMQLRLTHLWLHNTLLRSGAPCVCSHCTGLQKVGTQCLVLADCSQKVAKKAGTLRLPMQAHRLLMRVVIALYLHRLSRLQGVRKMLQFASSSCFHTRPLKAMTACTSLFSGPAQAFWQVCAHSIVPQCASTLSTINKHIYFSSACMPFCLR